MGERFNDIVILTGVDMSAESGLDIFRGAGRGAGRDGDVWPCRTIKDGAMSQAGRRRPSVVHAFHTVRRRAGNRTPIHMHDDRIKTRGAVRPHVIRLDEIPLHLDARNLFPSIHASGTVHPAAGMFDAIQQRANARTAESNLAPSARGTKFQQKIYGKAREIVPAYANQFLQSSV